MSATKVVEPDLSNYDGNIDLPCTGKAYWGKGKAVYDMELLAINGECVKQCI